MRWAPWQDDILRQHWSNGISSLEIAHLVGRTRNAVIGRAHRLGCAEHALSVNAKNRYQEQQRQSQIKTLKAKTLKAKTPSKIKRRPLTLPPAVIAAVKARPVVNSGTCTLEELECGQCRYPYGDMQEGGVRFCGQPVFYKSYCEQHWRATCSRHTAKPEVEVVARQPDQGRWWRR